MNEKAKTRIPRQKRSIEKKNRIMEAAMTMFSKKGIHQTNSKEIAAEAGVSIGSFYSYFPDKKRLLTEVLDIYLDKHFERIWQQNVISEVYPSVEFVRNFMENLLSAYDAAPDFHKETHALRYSDPEVKALYDKETEKELIQITAVLLYFKDIIKIKDFESASVVIHSSAENLVHKIKFMGMLDEKSLIDEFANMIYRYLMKK